MGQVHDTLKGRPPLDIPLQKILRAIKKHRRVAPAARALGCSDAYVWKRLKQAGLTLGQVLERPGGEKTRS